MSSSPSIERLPPVDARLVAPNSGHEILDGRVREVPGCDEPHGTRQSMVAALLEASVAEEFAVAVDMLTRTSKSDDFAPDASVFARARDPHTGGRRLEELAFEVLSTTKLSDVVDKARKLSRRGVRRVFAIVLRRERVFEWSVDADTWQVMAHAAAIEDRCLAVPVPVEALVKASRIDDAMARALLAKRHPVIVDAIDRAAKRRARKAREEGREEGRKEGREEGRKEGRRAGRKEGRKEGLSRARLALLRLAESRGLSFTDAQRARIAACSDLVQLGAWFDRALTSDHPDDVFATSRG